MIKKVNKIVLSILAAIMIFSSFASCAKEGSFKLSEQREPHDYTKLVVGDDPDVMPIGGYCGPNGMYVENAYQLPTLVTDEIYDMLKECGVNLIVDKYQDYAAKPELVESLFNLAAPRDIYYWIANSKIMNFDSNAGSSSVAGAKAIKEELDKMSKFKAFNGIYGRDEPSAAFFNKIASVNENYSTVNKFFKNKYNIYFNLFPPVPGETLSGVPGKIMYHDEYVKAFIETKPNYLMYDTYPFMGLESAVAGSWLSLMSVIRKAANDANIPWMGYIQAGGNFMDVLGAHRIATEGEMIWSVNTMIAHGAKGIAYFPLITPPEWTQQENTQDNALINKYGSKNAHYYYAKKVNTQLRAIDHILMNSYNVGVMDNGGGPCVLSNDVKLTDFRELKSISGSAAMVGCFDYKGKTALYVLNNSTSEKKCNVTLNFDDNYGYQVIQRGETIDYIGKSIPLKLDQGEGVMIVLK